MPEFAKLYGTGDAQLLVKIEPSDDETRAEVRVYGKPQGYSVCNVCRHWPNDAPGRAAARRFFDSLDEAATRELFDRAMAWLYEDRSDTGRPPAGKPVLTLVPRAPR